MYPPIPAVSKNLTGVEDNSADSLPKLGMRGYEVAAMVVCLLIVAALVMCYLTWKFRYKIVLRTAIKETTVVQNLVALTLQEAVGIGDNYLAGSGIRKVPPYQLTLPVDLPIAEIVVDGNQDSVLKKSVNSEKISQQRKVSEQSVQRGPGGVGVADGESVADRWRGSKDMGERHPPTSAAKRRASSASKPNGKQQRQQKRRSMVMSAVKLSSGQTIPRRVDHRKLSVGHHHHPLGDNKHKHGALSTPTLGLSVKGEGYPVGKENEQYLLDEKPGGSEEDYQQLIKKNHDEVDEKIVEVCQSEDVGELVS